MCFAPGGEERRRGGGEKEQRGADVKQGDGEERWGSKPPVQMNRGLWFPLKTEPASEQNPQYLKPTALLYTSRSLKRRDMTGAALCIFVKGDMLFQELCT